MLHWQYNRIWHLLIERFVHTHSNLNYLRRNDKFSIHCLSALRCTQICMHGNNKQTGWMRGKVRIAMRRRKREKGRGGGRNVCLKPLSSWSIKLYYEWMDARCIMKRHKVSKCQINGSCIEYLLCYMHIICMAQWYCWAPNAVPISR